MSRAQRAAYVDAAGQLPGQGRYFAQASTQACISACVQPGLDRVRLALAGGLLLDCPSLCDQFADCPCPQFADWLCDQFEALPWLADWLFDTLLDWVTNWLCVCAWLSV